MNIDNLRECVDLARTLSFTKTAQRFYLTQPVLSKHVAAVERELGIEIFLRGKNGVHLTGVGRAFVENCKGILRSYDSALEELEHLKYGGDRPLDLGYLYGAAQHILPKAIRAFSRRHPAIEVRYLSMEIDEIPAALDENLIDLAITADLEKFDADRFAWRLLYRDSLCLIVPRGHHLADREQVSVDDLVGEEIIVPRSTFMPNETSHIRRVLSPIVETVAQKKLIGDLNSIRMSLLVEGCGAVEFSHLRHCFSGDEFRFIPLNAAIPEFHIVAVWKRARETAVLLDLAAEFERLCKGGM